MPEIICRIHHDVSASDLILIVTVPGDDRSWQPGARTRHGNSGVKSRSNISRSSDIVLEFSYKLLALGDITAPIFILVYSDLFIPVSWFTRREKNLDILFIGKIWTGKKNRSQESKYFWQCCFEGRRESAIWSVQSSVVTPHATRDNLIREHLFCLWRGHWCWLVTRLRGGESQNNGTQLVHWYL